MESGLKKTTDAEERTSVSWKLDGGFLNTALSVALTGCSTLFSVFGLQPLHGKTNKRATPALKPFIHLMRSVLSIVPQSRNVKSNYELTALHSFSASFVSITERTVCVIKIISLGTQGRVVSCKNLERVTAGSEFETK